MAVNYNYSMPQQNFPQPQGNTYLINNSVEVSNIPTSTGISSVICLPENMLYLKTLQNGTPTFLAYKLTPFAQEMSKNTEENNFKVLVEKIEKIEKDIAILKKNKGGILNDQL